MDKEKEIKAYLDGELLPEVRMKYEIAEEMGLLDRVLSDGWKSLSAKAVSYTHLTLPTN